MSHPKIWLSSPHMGGKELSNVKDAFNSNWIAPIGPHINGFEQDLAAFLGEGVHVAALSSGTAALHLALIMLGVEAGDEVICQTMTFSASANPIAYLGAIPVFIDSERTTWNMSPDFLEEAILDRLSKGKKPRAIIVVHLYGMPAQMDRIMKISERYGIPLIEDAAEALGSTFKGQACGTFGEMSILSFNGNKIITTSGGGALVSKNDEWVKKSRFLATQARDEALHYQHSEVGYNYRMSNICAAIGCGQMEVLNERVSQRRNNFKFYKSAFTGVDVIRFAEEPNEDFFSNRWLSTILIESDIFTRVEIHISLLEKNIEFRPLWKPLHLQPVFKKSPFYGDNTAEYLFDHGVCLPSGSNLTEEELQRVVDAILEIEVLS